MKNWRKLIWKQYDIETLGDGKKCIVTWRYQFNIFKWKFHTCKFKLRHVFETYYEAYCYVDVVNTGEVFKHRVYKE